MLRGPFPFPSGRSLAAGGSIQQLIGQYDNTSTREPLHRAVCRLRPKPGCDLTSGTVDHVILLNTGGRQAC